jgi:glycosyltransferase involved in cell wall biosynthesis
MKYLAACCTLKNEENIVREWMAFHRAAGVEHLIMVDNGSTDNTGAIIRKFRDPESVTYISWPARTSQIELYDHVVSRFSANFEWCAFIDADEFLYPSAGFDLREEIARFPNAGAIGVHWHIFGSSGNLKKPSRPVIENYIRRAPDDFVFNAHVKSIVRLAKTRKAISSHIFDVEDGIIDENGNRLHTDPPHGFYRDRTPTHSRLRINHYHCRSKEEYEAKAKRGYFGVDDQKLQVSREKFEDMFAAHDRNEIVDTTAVKYLPLMQFYLPDTAAMEIPQEYAGAKIPETFPAMLSNRH